MTSAGPWRGAARIGPGWAAFLGAAGDNHLHSHHAIQTFAGPGALVADARGEQSGPGFIAPANVAHRAAAAPPSSFLYVDPDSASGQRIAAVVGDEIIVLSAAQASALTAIVAACIAGEIADPAERLAVLLGAKAVPLERDQRIETALAAFLESAAPLNTHALASAFSLSPSRVAHLFRDQVGVPLRSFLLWSKLRRAFTAIAQGLSLTEAAHHAGFADSAHFSRTCLRMFGASPQALTGAVKFHEA